MAYPADGQPELELADWIRSRWPTIAVTGVFFKFELTLTSAHRCHLATQFHASVTY